MTHDVTRMPPFAGLLAFEAVMRLGSMTLAAEELGLTQSAVSHRIRALEGFFGTSLIERLNPGLRPTEAGALLLRELLPALGALAGLRRRVAGEAGARVFRLGLGTPLLAWWLSPRLPALCEAHPDLRIEIVTWDTPVEAARSEVDLALRWLPIGSASEGHCELSFPQEHVFPVAAPKLLRGVRTAGHWPSLPLLAKGRRGEEAGREWSWLTWLGMKPVVETMRFRDIGSSLQAAVDGNGVALGRTLLVCDALSHRRLVRLVPPGEGRACTSVHVARWRDPNDAVAARMAAWLVQAARSAFGAGATG